MISRECLNVIMLHCLYFMDFQEFWKLHLLILLQEIVFVVISGNICIEHLHSGFFHLNHFCALKKLIEQITPIFAWMFRPDVFLCKFSIKQYYFDFWLNICSPCLSCISGEKGTLTHGSVLNGRFEGFIKTHQGTYYVEPSERYLQDKEVPFHSVIYHEDDISKFILQVTEINQVLCWKLLRRKLKTLLVVLWILGSWDGMRNVLR